MISTTTHEDDRDPLRDLLDRALRVRQELGDAPVPVHMNRETYRKLIIRLNPAPGAEPSCLYGLPIVFDETVSVDQISFPKTQL